MQTIIKENRIKNVLLIVILIFLFIPIQDYLISKDLNNADAGTILVATSIIAVIACFGNFAFTYEKINIKSASHRYLAHLTTGLLMLVIGISLLFTDILISFIIGRFFIIDVTLALLYIACVGYDSWDILRVNQ